MRPGLTIIIAGVIAVSPTALANPVTDELVNSLSSAVSQNFWGRAVLSSGKTVERPPDLDPDAPIIPQADARRVVEAAFPVGVAMWCEVEWRPYYLRFMQAERTRSWSEVQVAYVGVLFGLAQQTFLGVLAGEPDIACSGERKAEVEAALGMQPP